MAFDEIPPAVVSLFAAVQRRSETALMGAPVPTVDDLIENVDGAVPVA